MSFIKEFGTKSKPSDYYPKLINDIKELNEKLNIFNLINDKMDGGFPISVKDNICIKGVETTAGSKLLNGYIPPFTATCVNRLLSNSYGFLGKTNMDEFGFGSFGTNTNQPAKNPFDNNRVAGGSSSGAAVATSTIKYHVAICESTGGSISNPASFCGVVGFTPTYGTVSRYGLVDYANSLDKIGIMSRRSEDAKIVFDIMRSADKFDSTSTDKPITAKKKNKVVVINQLMVGVEEKIKSSFDVFIHKLEKLGYTIEYVDSKIIDKAIPAYYIISMAEASTNLAKYTGFKYGLLGTDFTLNYNKFFTEVRNNFGLEAKRRIIAGTFVRSASVKNRYYYKALKIRKALINEFSKILDDAIILNPTMPLLPPTFEEAKSLTPVQEYAMDSLTVPPNLCGLPHISFPIDYIDGLPIGAQITTSHFNDYALFDIVNNWENNFEYKFKYNLGDI